MEKRTYKGVEAVITILWILVNQHGWLYPVLWFPHKLLVQLQLSREKKQAVMFWKTHRMVTQKIEIVPGVEVIVMSIEEKE